jgi:hypothetical protein
MEIKRKQGKGKKKYIKAIITKGHDRSMGVKPELEVELPACIAKDSGG